MAPCLRQSVRGGVRLWAISAVIAAFSGLTVAAADPLSAGRGKLFRLDPASSYQHGCFPPCLCPIMEVRGVLGTMKLSHAGLDSGIDSYSVAEVNWIVPSGEPPLRVTGAGRYEIGSPTPLTVLQHRMVLELRVGEEPVQRFDSGWVPLENREGIHIAVSINGMYCLDTAIAIHALAVRPEQIRPYRLTEGSTFQRTCFDPCDCPPGPELPMAGTFDLVPLYVAPFVGDFAVLNVRWHAADTSIADGPTVRGLGTYHRLADPDPPTGQRLLLDALIDGKERARFDSGVVPAPVLFPAIDIVATINGMECFDTVLHVVAHPQERQVCGGIQGLPCDEGEFCKLPVGACCCDFQGVCLPIPEVCPAIADPVCGCDGATYANECEADRAGITIARFGACEQQRCTSDLDCADANVADAFCKFPEGTCGSLSSGGVCTPVPDACPRIYDPVCGCDGTTYSNECEAERARVSVRYRGPCEQECSEALGLPPCPDDMFCHFPEGTCDNGQVLGVCRPRPLGCPDVWDPVCGCDGNTYSNECDAFAAGVSIRHRGECARFCGGWHGDTCTPEEFCKFPTGICNDAADHFGVCTLIPDACPEFADPVCGCDGNTYDNECFADMAAVSLLHRGRCEPSPCAATRVFAGGPVFCPDAALPVRVAIEINPPDGASSIGLEDRVPSSWQVVEISHEGAFDPTTEKVKWRPFFPPFPVEVHYAILPGDAAIPPCFSGTISVDGINEPVCGPECLRAVCAPFMEADLPQPDCPACPMDCTTCADDECHSRSIGLCEVTGYACAWKRGCNDDLAGMTRAGFIWKSGECYCWEVERENWFPTDCPGPASGVCGGTAGAAAADSVVPAPLGSTMETAPGRTDAALADSQNRRRTFTLTVPLTAPEGTAATALEVYAPSGWTVSTASHDGRWDAGNRAVKWGPFVDAVPESVELTVQRTMRKLDPSDPDRPRAGSRTEFSATASFDGANQLVKIDWNRSR